MGIVIMKLGDAVAGRQNGREKRLPIAISAQVI
jgi:hypothetical protein